MAANNQLRARLDRSQNNHIEEIAEAEGVDRTEAERAVVKEGLMAMGYVDRPTDPAKILLYYVRLMGELLGLVGLVVIGYGIFWGQTYSIVGFGITMIGLLLVITADVLPRFVDHAIRVEEADLEGELTS